MGGCREAVSVEKGTVDSRVANNGFHDVWHPFPPVLCVDDDLVVVQPMITRLVKRETLKHDAKFCWTP